MDISVRKTEYTVEDRSWLGSRDGTEFTRSVTLDVSAFDQATHYPNGYIPSGTVLGRITATGLYGPYNNALNNGQEVAEGFLFNSTQVRAGGPDVGAPLQWRGVIRTSRLPIQSTAPGGLDANARADLAAKFRFE
ncbi:MAG TPA: head decoration protein [Micromonosporaceae bacterium]